MFVTPLGDTHDIKESVAALQRAATYVRRELASRIRVYRIPRIQFQLDPQMPTASSMIERKTDGPAADHGTQALAARPDDGP